VYVCVCARGVVKAQPQPPVDVEPAQRIRLRPSGIEDREHMRHTSCAMALQLFDPANCHLERHELLFGHHCGPPFGAARSVRLSHGCGKSVHVPSRQSKLRCLCRSRVNAPFRSDGNPPAGTRRDIPVRHSATLFAPGLQLAADRTEGCTEASADQCKGGDRRHGNQCCDQRIFYCGNAAAVLDQPVHDLGVQVISCPEAKPPALHRILRIKSPFELITEFG